MHQFYNENEANKDDKVQAAKIPDSRSLFIFKICVAKNRSGSREGFFFTVNLVFSLSKQNRMQESLPIAEGHDPTTNEISKVFPSILSPHSLHSAAPCHALLPQQDTATSNGLSGQVPEGSSGIWASSLPPIQKLLGKCYIAKRNILILW